MADIRVRVGSEFSVPLKELPLKVRKKLENNLTFVNPEYKKKKRQNLYVKNIPQFLTFYSCRSDWMYMPRGFLQRATTILKESGLSPKFLTRGVVTRSRGRVPLEDFNVSLRPYQLNALEKMHKGVQGVVQMPCGAGKTELGCAALLTTGEPGLVIVHTEDILDQWKNRIHRMSGDWPRVISGTRRSDFSPLNPGEVAIAMIQTLCSAGSRADDFLNSVGAVLTDECHHIPARTWAKTLSSIKARYRWGLTATPNRSDGLSFVLNLSLGETLFNITTQYLIDNGYLEQPLIVPVWTGWVVPEDCYPASALCTGCMKWRKTTIQKHNENKSRCSSCKSIIPKVNDLQRGKLNYSKALSEMSLDAGRMELVRRLVAKACDDGRTVLVLVPRKRAVSVLVTKLRWEGIEALGVTSDYNKETRARFLREIREKKASVIVATQLADEGLDLPGVDCAINTSAGKHTGTAKQRVGRTLRKGGKDPIVFDFVDTGEFERQWLIRAQAYRKEYGKCFYSAQPIETDLAIKVFEDVQKKEAQKLTGV